MTLNFVIHRLGPAHLFFWSSVMRMTSSSLRRVRKHSHNNRKDLNSSAAPLVSRICLSSQITEKFHSCPTTSQEPRNRGKLLTDKYSRSDPSLRTQSSKWAPNQVSPRHKPKNNKEKPKPRKEAKSYVKHTRRRKREFGRHNRRESGQEYPA